VLSHTDADAVVADIAPALKVILSQKLGHDVEVKPIIGLREALIRDGVIDGTPKEPITRREYGIAA
jgi:hypothetical protein